ncbi:ricin-type beta-trefoil lectin domain protein [Sorangium sp. So ce1504]|uniref:ricin-type beta-trefoil lectin domain protein n=1 Tax=Sorangium sp. So ce1504 TaxID=3133337 RepID=UPI003F5E6C0B
MIMRNRFGVQAIFGLGLALLPGCVGEPGADGEGAGSSFDARTELAFPGVRGRVEERIVDLPGLGPQKVVYERIGGVAVFEGDILLDERDRQARSAARLVGASRWPGGVVPYTIDASLPNQARVNDAIAHMQSATPLRFKLRTTEVDYVTFRPSTGCSSLVGRSGGQQFIDLASGCLTGSTIHEIGHAVGLYHEQSRADRDETITVHFENIDPGHQHNFFRYVDSNKDGVDLGPYDLGSIMHYDAFTFSANGQPTITKKDGTTFTSQRVGLSNGDIRALEAMYGRRVRLRTGVASNRCLDVSNSSTEEGATVQTWECNGTSAQEWLLTPSGELRSSVAPNRCLDVSGGDTTPGAQVQTWECNGTDAQKWTRSASGELRSALAANLCLDVAGGSTAEGAAVQTGTCSGSNAQKWSDYVEIQSDLSWNRCLHVAGASSTPGTNVAIWDCDESNGQQWFYSPSFELRSAIADDRCLEVDATGAVQSGTNVQIGVCNGSNAQKWLWTAAGKVLTFLNSGLCLDVSGGAIDPGTNVQILQCNDTRAQRWMRPSISF